jgi:precorrin isomerase
MFKIDASTKMVFSVSGNEHLVANENGDILLENARIISPDPIDASHLSTKGYVDVGSTILQSNINLKADQATTYTKTETDSHIQAIVGNAPSSLNTLEKIATQLVADESLAGSLASLTNTVALKAPLASPSFTGIVSGITAGMVGAYTKNETDTALALKADQATTYTKTETDSRIQTVIGSAPAALDTLAEIATQLSNDENAVTALTNTVSLKAPLVSPIFSGIPTAPTPVSGTNTTQIATTEFVKSAVTVTSVSGRTGSITLTKSDVGLSNVDNTSDLNKPVSTAQNSAIALKADQATTYTKTETDSRIQTVIGSAPAALDTLAEIAAQLSNDENAVTALTNTVSLKAPLASPSFTGTVSGITASMVGAYTTTQVDTALALKADSTVVAALNATVATKAPLASPTFTGTVSGITASMVGAYTTTQVDSALALKAPLVSPIFSGIPTAPTPVSTDNSTQLATTAYVTNAVKVTSVSGRTGSVVLTKSDVGLSNVDNTSDLNKPVSTIQQTALDLKANQSTTYTKTETDTRIQAIVGAAPAALDTLVEIAAQLATDESAAATLTNTVALKAPIASPVFTGIPTVPTPSVGDSTSQIANTQFVITSIANALAVLDGGTY